MNLCGEIGREFFTKCDEILVTCSQHLDPDLSVPSLLRLLLRGFPLDILPGPTSTARLLPSSSLLFSGAGSLSLLKVRRLLARTMPYTTWGRDTSGDHGAIRTTHLCQAVVGRAAASQTWPPPRDLPPEDEVGPHQALSFHLAKEKECTDKEETP